MSIESKDTVFIDLRNFDSQQQQQQQSVESVQRILDVDPSSAK